MTAAVKTGDKVKVEYEGTFDDGEVFDSSKQHGGEPLEFEVGAHQVIQGFEDAVLGKEIGEEFSIHLEPGEAYGERDENLKDKLPLSAFPKERAPEPGMMLQLQQKHGDHSHTVLATIVEVGTEDVTIDLNHPMAGKPLNFKMKIIAIS